MQSGRASLASSGRISGSGFASARISGRSDIFLTIAGLSTPPADRPRKTSAPAMTSSSVRALVSMAKRSLSGSISSLRPFHTTPLISVTVMLLRGRPIFTSSSRQASAAAPAPETTSFISFISFPITFKPFRNAAPTMIAVPCWSSWNTGIFMRARSLRSTMKHSGALMSSRLMPPKVGSSAAMISTSLSGSRSSISMSKQSMPANFLNSTALPSITGLAASGPSLPVPAPRSRW